jgi:hypothetical protein
MILCVVCLDQGKQTSVVGLCNELDKPVCADHAYWCDQEKHGWRPLGAERITTDDRKFLGSCGVAA